MNQTMLTQRAQARVQEQQALRLKAQATRQNGTISLDEYLRGPFTGSSLHSWEAKTPNW